MYTYLYHEVRVRPNSSYPEISICIHALSYERVGETLFRSVRLGLYRFCL
jgi:hypothetical protein